MNAQPDFIKASLASLGEARIAAAFDRARHAGRAALMPYYTLGFPTPDLSVDVITAVAQAGADLLELGVPFSDPLADGPVIQRSTQIALEQGTTPARCLELTAALRRRGVEIPVLLMGYINPLLAYGLEKFVSDAARVGVDGFIVPDLPPEEAGELAGYCRSAGLALVYLAAPNTTSERLEKLAGLTRGFLYLVSLTGVTGARHNLPLDLAEFVQRAREVAQTPLVVGFGISNPQQAGQVGRLVDGVIVGSALIQTVADALDPVQSSYEFISGMLQGIVAKAEPDT
jgi:tryptophan synthase alpha chain